MPENMNIENLTATTALESLAGKRFSAEELAREYLGKVDDLEDVVGAWAFLDRELVLNQAKEADSRSASGQDISMRLNGIPVGIKDIFDTCDMPTENGTIAHRGRTPEQDSLVVERLRKEGALLMGKTVTAELAVYSPGKTTNPHDPARTPGGSSSGSAAAVAAGMVPLAIGTQTNGSVIRPASYCGVVGFKPTFGTISRKGIIRQAPSLDQVGVFSRTVQDSALLASVLMGDYDKDSSVLPYPKVDMGVLETAHSASPRLGYVKTPVWQEASSQCQEAFLGYVRATGTAVEEIELPGICDKAVACHRTIMLREMAHNYKEFHTIHRKVISDKLLGMLDDGAKISLDEYFEAKEQAEQIADVIGIVLKDFDAVLTPATDAEAPVGLEATGSPIFCTLWSLCGVPAITIPVLTGSDSMPLGLQLVGAKGYDSKLLMAARWVEQKHRK